MSVVFTPLSHDQTISGELTALRWEILGFKLGAMLEKLVRVAAGGIGEESDVPSTSLQFMQYLVRDGSPLPESFLLPFEQKMLPKHSDASRKL